MKPSELKDLKHLAMLAEQARPLAHECNNFLNNLLLQLAISEKSVPEPARAEWANIRREGKKLASLFQQWQRQRKQVSEGPTKFELNQLIDEVVAELRSESVTVQLLVRPACEAVWITGFTGEVQRLVSLLLRYAVSALQSSGVDDPALEIQVEKGRDRILLRLLSAGSAHANLLWADFDDLASSERSTLSLPALTCKSLVEHLDGDVRIDRDANGCMVLAVGFPLTDS
jgi:signal transduction histidine kinase